MTIEEIRKGAPEGATHYTTLNFIGGVEYFKLYKSQDYVGSIYVWDEMWRKLAIEQHSHMLAVVKPL